MHLLKNILSIFILIGAFACQNPENNGSKTISEEQIEQKDYTDPRDRQQYNIKISEGMEWFAENLRYNVDGSLAPVKEGYGRFYSWNQAQKACPPGWRLPRKSDLEPMESFGLIAYENYKKESLDNLNIIKTGKAIVVHGSELKWVEEGQKAFLWTSYEELVYNKDTNLFVIGRIIPEFEEADPYLYMTKEEQIKWEEVYQSGSKPWVNFISTKGGKDYQIESEPLNGRDYIPCRCLRIIPTQ